MNSLQRQIEKDFDLYLDTTGEALDELQKAVISEIELQMPTDKVLALFKACGEALTKADKEFKTDIAGAELEFDDVEEYLRDNPDRKDAILDLLDIEEKDPEAISVSGLNLNQRAALEDFLTTHIYPDYNQQKAFIDGL